MANPPEVDAALRTAAAKVAGVPANTADVQLATYGTTTPNLAQTVGYDDYMGRINRNMLPPVQANGSYYSPPGAMEGYRDYGIPPVLRQGSPFATAGYRSFVDPFGQMMVQPLVGFPSAYPHVLSGVPMNPFYGSMYAAQMGPIGYPWGFGMGMMPPMGGGMPPARNTGSGNNNTKRNTTTTRGRVPFFYGDTDTMPLPAGYRERNIMPGAGPTAQPSEPPRVIATPTTAEPEVAPSWMYYMQPQTFLPTPQAPDVPRVGTSPTAAEPEVAPSWMYYMQPQTSVPEPAPTPTDDSSVFWFNGSDWDRAMQHLNPPAPPVKPVVPAPAPVSPAVPEPTAVPMPDNIAALWKYYG